MLKEHGGAVVYQNFISLDKIEIIRDEIKTLTRYKYDNKSELHYTSESHMYVAFGESETLSSMFLSITEQIKTFIEGHYKCTVGSESIGSAVCTGEGWELSLHHDYFEIDGKSLETHAGYPSRDITSLLYLNDYGKDFNGGDLFMPNQDLFLFPKAGTLVVFPTSEDYKHQVAPITSGERQNVTTFWHVLERFDLATHV